jgi:hypothetical protein
VSEKTIYRWSKDATLQDRVNDHRGEFMNAAMGQLVNEIRGAVDVVRDIAHSGTTERIRLQAAIAIINQAKSSHITKTDFSNNIVEIPLQESKSVSVSNPSGTRRFDSIVLANERDVRSTNFWQSKPDILGLLLSC